MPEPRCPACAAAVRAGGHFCTTCGRRLSAPVDVDTLVLRLRQAGAPAELRPWS